MKRMATILGIYISSLAIMVIVMAWVTLRTLDLEHQERLTAVSAENERLALWRIGSMILPMILEESSRDYSAVASESSSNPIGTRIPVAVSPYVRCYFQCDSSGRFDFVHAVSKSEQGKQILTLARDEQVDQLQQLLAADVREHRLFEALQEMHPASEEFENVQIAQRMKDKTPQTDPLKTTQQSRLATGQPFDENSQFAKIQARQRARSFTEFQTRLSNSMQTQQSVQSQFKRLRTAMPGLQSEINAGPMTVFWLNGHLFLARLMRTSRNELAQGCLLDWDELKHSMREQISDLLPEAELVPIPIGESGDDLSLATVPARLIPGRTVLPDQPPWSPMQVSLMMAWCWLLLSAAAIGALLFGVVRLSERRAAFVSAVTHELRTPLTTFQLSSDLLANRQTLTDEKQTRYVETLRVEAERLGHLVENVLSWSRLDQSADTELIEQVAWSELLSRIEPSLDDCAGQAGMTLETDRLRKRSEIRFCGNRTAVERILFNLIDNACKYAKHADDKRIHLELEAFHSEVKIRVRDHGPDIPAEIRSILFEPFTKSATDAARSEAGVGLGLSLCRRLARNMNGDLILQDSSPAGVTFQLRLPTTG